MSDSVLAGGRGWYRRTSPGMPFLRLARWSRVGVAVCGFLALALGDQLGGVAAAAAASALLATMWGIRPSWSPRTWTALQLLFLLWIAAGLTLLARPALTVFAELLVFVQVHRLLSHQGARDDAIVCLISFGQLLLATVLTIEPLFFALYVAYVVFLLGTLLCAQLQRSVEKRHRLVMPSGRAGPSAYAPLDALARWPVVASGMVSGLALVASSVLLFFVLPRAQASFLEGRLLPAIAVSGFSDRVRLGEVGMMQLSNKPVLRAVLRDREGKPAGGEGVYWHGLALDRFDGRAWELSERKRTPLAALHSPRKGGPPQERPWTLVQDVRTEALDSDVLFHVGEATGIYGSMSSLEAVSTSGYAIPGARGRRSYRVYSDPRRPLAIDLRSSDPRDSLPALRVRYTQLPQQLSPRFASIARSWTQGAKDSIDEVLLVQERLRDDFTYSLDQVASAYPDPLLAFLDEVKEGHCEYYASAMAVLLRTQGIPARIVNGFAGGLWNSVGDYWLVRQRDAHSWVEVHFPDHGWVLFDPTPSAVGGLQGIARLGLVRRLEAWADYGADLWSRALLDYDVQNQATFVRGVFQRWAEWQAGEGRGLLLPQLGVEEVDVGPRPLGEITLWFGLALGLFSLVLLLGWRHRRALMQRTLGEDAARLRPPVQGLLRRWRRRGDGARRAGEEGVPEATASVLVWARWAASNEPASYADAPACIEDYYAVRFGSAASTEGLLRRLGDLKRGV